MKVEESKQDEEFGPWHTHCGSVDPVPKGTVVEVVRANGVREVITRGMGPTLRRCSDAEQRYWRSKRLAGLSVVRDGRVMSCAWLWKGFGPKFNDIIEYRIKKPRGMVILEEILNSLPTPTKQKQKENAE